MSHLRGLLKQLLKEYLELRDKGLPILDERDEYNDLLDKYEDLIDKNISL